MSADLLTEMERHLAMLDQLYEEDVQAQDLDASSIVSRVNSVPARDILADPRMPVRPPSSNQVPRTL